MGERKMEPEAKYKSSWPFSGQWYFPDLNSALQTWTILMAYHGKRYHNKAQLVNFVLGKQLVQPYCLICSSC
jgi:hypothetical protein